MAAPQATTAALDIRRRETLAPLSGVLKVSPYLVGGALLAVAVVLGFFAGGLATMLHVYLTGFAFVLALVSGALFFNVIQHITRAGWSVGVRRLAELVGGCVPFIAVAAIPLLLVIVFRVDALYHWLDAEMVAGDPLIEKKAPYFYSPFGGTGFPTFTVLRFVAYFAILFFFGRRLLAISLRQDDNADNPEKQTFAEARLSAVGIYVLALTCTFLAIDLLMSLDPHWFSTIFGVYFFAQSMVTFLAVATIAVVILSRPKANGVKNFLEGVVTVEHKHDLGKLLFGFNCFWAYIAFSQYLLIWYANIPEETEWYLHRQNFGWGIASIILLVGHFAIPFFGFISRHMKRDDRPLVAWAVWILAFQAFDFYWVVMPEADRTMMTRDEIVEARADNLLVVPDTSVLEGMETPVNAAALEAPAQLEETPTGPDMVTLAPAGPGIFSTLAAILSVIGMGGLFLGYFLSTASGHPLWPIRDPRLEESVHFENI